MEHRFTTNNYSQINKAIDNEVRKQTLLNKLNVALARKHLLIGLSVAGVSLAAMTVLFILGYKLWLANFSDTFESKQTDINQHREGLTKEESEELKELGGNFAGQSPLIKTRYTVFRETVVDSGDTVITGLTYEPTNIAEPIEQYCYIEGANLTGTALAEVNGNEVVYITENPHFQRLVSKHCLFEIQRNLVNE